MENTILPTMVLAALFLFLFLKATFRHGQKYNLPPGPKPWPIIGKFDLIGTLSHRSIHELSKKYGPLMHLRFASLPLIVASSVDMARFFLRTKDIFYMDRPKTASGKYTTYNYADITWSPDDTSSAPHLPHQALQPTTPRTDGAHPCGQVHAMVRRVGPSALCISIGTTCLTLSLNVITRMVMGKRLFADGSSEGPVPSMEVFRWMMDELFLLNGVLNMSDWIPWLDWRTCRDTCGR